MLTTWLDLQLLDSKFCSHPGCQTWGANHDLERKVSIGFMNALCCCRQTLPSFKKLTNCFDDNLLHIVNIAPKFDWPILFAHPFAVGKLMTILPWHLKAQKVTFRTWMQTKAHDQKWYFQEDHDTKKHDQGITWQFFH